MTAKVKARKIESPEDHLRVLADLMRDQMIIQLGLAGLPQQKIREIVGVDIVRVNRIVKHFKQIR